MRLVVFFLLYMLLNSYSYAQRADNWNALSLAKSALDGYKYEAPPKRKLLSFHDKRIIARLNPLNYLAAGALFFYQRIFSEQIQANCMYEISCSNYTKLSIKEHGIKGFLSGIDQLNSCFSGALNDYPDYMISPELKIKNQLNK